MNKYRYITSTILLLLFAACNPSKENSQKDSNLLISNDSTVRKIDVDSSVVDDRPEDIAEQKAKKSKVSDIVKTEEGRIIKNLVLVDSIYIPDPLAKFKYSNGSFYAVNRSKQTIVMLDESFEVIKELGGKGAAPEQNKLIIDYFPLDDQTVLIIDPNKNDIKIQDFNNELQVYKKFNFNIDKAAPLGNQKVIIAHDKNDSKDSRMAFSIWDIHKDTIEKTNELTEQTNYPFSNLVADGQFIVGDSEIPILYLQYFHDHMLKIKNDNQVVQFDFIRQVKVPKGANDGGWVYLDDSTPRQVTAYLSDNVAYVISNIPSKQDRDKRVLDVYDLKTMRYIKSFILPKLNFTSPKDIVFQAGKYYLSYEDKVYIFKEDKTS